MYQLHHVILIFDQSHLHTNYPTHTWVRTITPPTHGCAQTDGRRDGGTGHFVLPDLPEHTTTCGASGPKIRNLVPRF